MTREIWQGPSKYLIQGVGPYAIEWPYAEGSVVAKIVTPGGTVVDLEPGQAVVSSVSSDTRGDLTLSADVAILYQGCQLVIRRNTLREQGWGGLMGARERGLETQLDTIMMSVQELSADVEVSEQLAVSVDEIERAAAASHAAMLDVQGAALLAADRSSLLANTDAHPVGAVFSTRAEGYSFEVVDVGGVLVTAGGVKLRPTKTNARVTPRMFGASADGITNDRAAILACWTWAAANGVTVDMEGLEYACNEAIYTDSGLRVEARGATIFFTQWPVVGGFLTNVWGSSETPNAPLRRIQKNVRIDGLVLDGGRLPVPVPGQQHNSNLFGFARGASDFVVSNCLARRMRFGTGAGTGGAGFGDELGATGIRYENCTAEDCYRGCRVQSQDGTWTDGGNASKRLRRIRFRDFTAIRCGTGILAMTPLATQPTDLTASDFDAYDVVFEGVTTLIDCGHYPWTPLDYTSFPGIQPQKTGAVVFGGARNIRIHHVRARIATDLTTRADWLGQAGYPAAGTNFVGAGLSGNVGALFWGHGRNIVIDHAELDGSVDALYKCARGVAFGEIASGPPTSTTETQQIRIRSIAHVRGACQYIFDGMVTSGGVGLDNAKLSIRLEDVMLNSFTHGVVGPNGTTGLTSVWISLVNRMGRRLAGSAADFLTSGVTPASLPADDTVLGTFAMAGGHSATGTRAGASYTSKAIRLSADATPATPVAAFYNPNGLVGSIQTSGSATVYATSSDERLKEDPQDFDALEIVEALRVYDHAWRSGGRGFGVYAQEAAAVVPQAVILGDSDENWNLKGDGERIPWSVDYTKLVPILLKAVQELSGRLNEKGSG